MDNILSFEQILSTVSEDEMLIAYEYKKNEELNRDNLQPISPEKQRFYLAFYAKAAYEHVGFDGFSKENQEQFKSQIKQLYANIAQARPQGEFLGELASTTAKYIEDRHFEVGTGSKTFHGGEKKEPTSVGDNFFFKKDKPLEYQAIGQGWSEEFGEKFPTWEMGTMKQGNEDILVISIPNLGSKNDYESWQDFIETFDKIYLENKEKWDKGRIILDVRGNRGGEDKPIDHVAKRLYGNMLNTYKRCEIKDTALSNHFLHQHGAYKPQNYERSGLKEQDLVKRQHFSGQKRTLFDETKVYYPFNEQTGYQGRIDILIDRDVGSSAESAYTSFYHHKNVRYIGENTSGMQQYTQGTFPAPWGGGMRVGVTKLTYWDKEGENIEVRGHKPDINCSGTDAFEVALSIDVDKGRIIGFREKNEKETENQVYAEYNPKAATDPRKAYYAKYLDPAIAEIEKQNSEFILRDTCRDIYHQNIEGILSDEDKSYLENVFMQTTGVYKYHEPQKISNLGTSGRNTERLQNIIRDLCNGEYPANQEIKNFLLKKGYIQENNKRIEFSSSFILQTPDNGLSGGHTKADKDGNVLIVINQQQAEKSDASLAVVLGHEICHQMINDKLNKNATSAEIEALCDIVGLVSAKGAGYDIRNKIAEDEQDFSRENQKKVFEHYLSGQPSEVIDKKVDEHMEKTVNTFYMPKKLNLIANFIDVKVPVANGNKNRLQEKINTELAKARQKCSALKTKTTEVIITPKTPYKPQKTTIDLSSLRYGGKE